MKSQPCRDDDLGWETCPNLPSPHFKGYGVLSFIGTMPLCTL